jgi:hypothetical protein
MTNPQDLKLPSQERTANKLRDEGMALAVDSANARHPIWSLRAIESLKRFLLISISASVFMTEEFRQWAENFDNLPTPPSGRAYGAVMIKAVKMRLITSYGYAKTTNPKAHRTPATLWREL